MRSNALICWLSGPKAGIHEEVMIENPMIGEINSRFGETYEVLSLLIQL